MKNVEKPIANPWVVLREEFDDWALLFHVDTCHGFGLNCTGVYVWKLLDGAHGLDAILEKLRNHAEDMPQEAGDHISAFVDQLVAQGLTEFDSTKFGLGSDPKKSSSSPLAQVSEVAPFNYEPPQLMNLSGEGQAAYGAGCSPGTHAFKPIVIRSAFVQPDCIRNYILAPIPMQS